MRTMWPCWTRAASGRHARALAVRAGGGVDIARIQRAAEVTGDDGWGNREYLRLRGIG
jgi:hypothetical protein